MGYAAVLANAFKIGIDHTGIFQITPEQLHQMGYNDAGEVAVYGYGASEMQEFDFNKARPDYFPEVPTMITDDGRLLFYATGPSVNGVYLSGSYIYGDITSNTSATTSCYFVVPKQDATHIYTPQVEADGNTITTHYSVIAYNPTVTNPAKSGCCLLSEDITRLPDRKLVVDWETPGMVANSSLFFRIRGAMKATKPRLLYNLMGRDQQLNAQNSLDSYNEYDISFSATDYKTLVVSTGNTPVENCTLTVSLDNSSTYAYAAVESATISYMRSNCFDSERQPITMFLNKLLQGRGIFIANARKSTVVWDVTDYHNTVQLPSILVGDDLLAVNAINNTSVSKLIAFDTDGKIPSVNLMGSVELGTLSTMEVPEMVIITAPAYRYAAERLAEIHRSLQNISVAVVLQQDIFNEFSSGAKSPYAIRRFMKKLYDRDPATLKHLLIIGPATYDPSGQVTGSTHDDTHVITYETEDFTYQGNSAKSYCSDAFYGMLDGTTQSYIINSPLTINVARIPVANEGQLHAYINKIHQYLTRPIEIDHRAHALIIGDYGDNGGHTVQADALADSIQTVWAPNTTVTKAMLGLFGNANIALNKVTSTINKGVGYISYSGHGSTTSIGSNNFFKRQSASLLNNSTYPFIMLSTCYSLGYDRDEHGIAESLLLKENGGGIAVIGAGRSVQMSLNQYLNLRVAHEFYNLSESNCTGDIYRVARNYLMKRYASRDLVLNTACYNFIGDPALPLYPHTHGITIDNDDRITINPLSSNSINGYITTDGSPDNSFNGTIIVNLYNPAVTDSTTYDKSASDLKITRRETIVASAQGTITDGRFSTQLHCPIVTESGNDFVITVHALSSNNYDRAVTSLTNVTVNELNNDTDLSDPEGPEIELFYINTPNFSNGDMVGNEFTIHALIKPSKWGISTITTLDRPTYLLIDGNRYTDILGSSSLDPDGNLIITYTPENINDGSHSATIVISDNAANRSTASLSFNTISEKKVVSLNIDETTASGSVTVSLKHDLDNEPTGSLTIEDAAGNVVRHINNTKFPFTWDLTDNNHKTVPDGRYTLRAHLKSGLLHTLTPDTSVIVVKE